MKAKRISILALVVIVALLLGVLAVAPFSAMAEEVTQVWNWNELLNAVNSDKTNIVLMVDIEDVVPDDELPTKHRLVFNGGLEYTLDLNEHEINVINAANEYYTGQFSLIEVSSNSSLNIKNGSIAFNNYYSKADRKSMGAVAVKDTSTLNATNVNMSNKYTGTVVYATDNADVTLFGGDYKVQNGFAIYLERQASLTLDGGVYIHTVMGDATNTAFVDGYGALYSESTGTLNVDNVLFKSGVQVSSSQIGAFSVSTHEVTINDKVLTEDIFEGTNTEAKQQNKEYYWYVWNQCALMKTENALFANTVKVINLQKKYPITIESGVAYISGAPVTEASYGQEVTIVADAPEQGMEFARWGTNGVTLTNTFSATTTFNMVALPVEITAYYGNETIKSVSATVGDIIPGKKVYDTEITLANGEYLQDYEWREDSLLMDEDDIFKAGKTYTLNLLVYPRDEHLFGDTVTATINGNNATVNAFPQYVYVNYAFEPTPSVGFSVKYDEANSQLGVGGKIVLDTALMADQSAEFATALGQGQVTYQWYRNGEVVEGATASTYELTAEDANCKFYAVVNANGKTNYGYNVNCSSNLYRLYLNAGDIVPGGLVPQVSPATPGVSIDAESLYISEILGENSYSIAQSIGGVILVPGKSYRLLGTIIEQDGVYLSTGASVYVNDVLLDETLDSYHRFFYDFEVPAVDFPVYYTTNGAVGIGVTLTVDVERMRTENSTFKNAYDHANATYQTVFYQWYKNGEEIEGATDISYTVKSSDKNSLIHCQVTLVDGKYGVGEQYSISNAITVFTVEMPIPKAGEERITSGIYADGVTIQIMWWPQETGATMNEGDTYEEGVVYEYYIVFSVKSGLVMADAEDRTVFVYGEKATHVSGYAYTGEITALHSHQYDDEVWAYDEEGYHWQPCVVPGCPNPHEEMVMFTEHWGGGATCQQTGICGQCGKEYLGYHDFSNPDYTYVDDMMCANFCEYCDLYVDADYHSGGVSTCQSKSICEWCHHEYGKLADHAGGTATCYERAICSTCGEEYGDLLDHDWSESWDYKDANGHAHLCENSGCTAHDSIIPHTPNIANPTEEEAKVCTVCEYVIAPRLNHVHALTPVSATPATCTENGNTAYYTCNCGQWFSDSEGNNLIADHSSVIIPATNHNYEGVAWSSDANEHYKVCKNNNCYEKGEVATHTPNIANPTEEEAKVCTVCGYVIAPALNHVHALTPVVAKSATCTENGNVAYYTCTCGQWFSDENATNLIANHDSVIVVASGHTDANTDGTCDTCGWVDPNFTPIVPGPGGGEGTPAPTPDNTPEIEGEEEAGLSGGAIAGIAVGATAGAVGLGAGGFAIFWFVVKKKSLAELLAIFKKAPKATPNTTPDIPTGNDDITE